jgi:cytochrome c-type biogenesis protein CcmH
MTFNLQPQRFPQLELNCYTRIQFRFGRPIAVRLTSCFSLFRSWRMSLLVVALATFSHWGQAAAIDIHEFANDTERDRYQSFIDDMRCPKCQNQNLSGSDSPIAKDLRNELYIQIKDGRSDQEIVSFMVERYGEFILYKPRLSPATIALWSLPIVLLLLGAGILTSIIRRRRLANNEVADLPLSADEQARLQALLKKSPSVTNNNEEPKA